MEAAESSDQSPTQTKALLHRWLATGVHLFTASGAVWGLFAVLEISRNRLDLAMIFMLVALAIDSLDGTLARRVGVEKFAPQIDGRRLDDIVDYLNFVFIPCLFMQQAGSVLHPGWLALPILASALGFSQHEAKTDDHFFLGFPSYWNILAFYLWLLDLSALVGTIWVVGLSIAIFIPYKYIYPSQLSNRSLRHFLNYSGCTWGLVLAWAALNPERAAEYHVTTLSLAYPALYLALSFKLGGLHRPER